MNLVLYYKHKHIKCTGYPHVCPYDCNECFTSPFLCGTTLGSLAEKSGHPDVDIDIKQTKVSFIQRLIRIFGLSKTQNQKEFEDLFGD